jgi:hypothetical protein
LWRWRYCRNRQTLPLPNNSVPLFLGLPLSLKKLTKAELQVMIHKNAKKRTTWRSLLLTRSGRLMLIKAVFQPSQFIICYQWTCHRGCSNAGFYFGMESMRQKVHMERLRGNRCACHTAMEVWVYWVHDQKVLNNVLRI